MVISYFQACDIGSRYELTQPFDALLHRQREAGEKSVGRCRAERNRLSDLSRPLLLVSIACAAPSAAEVRQIIVDQESLLPADAGRHLPEYRKLRGRIFGDVDPTALRNRVIQDVELAPRNANGRVEYISTFTILAPTSAGNGVLLDEIPNRGNQVTPFGTDGTTFLRAHGYSVAWIGWQGDLPHAPSPASVVSAGTESLAAPRLKDVQGQYLLRIPSATGDGPSGDTMRLEQGGAGPLAYRPASFASSDAKLTGGAPETAAGAIISPRHEIASSDWLWWNCKANRAADAATPTGDLCIKLLKGSFVPSESYTLVFPVTDPLVLGLGFAATRDAVSFLRYAQFDQNGSANPLAGKVRYVIGQGQSQVGNFVKLFIGLGFNADTQGRIVWDGANAHIAGRLVPLNIRFAAPGGSATLYAPGSEGFLWWGASRTVRGDRGSLLDRCAASATCPKIFETFGSSELWNQRISAGMVTPDLKADIRLPENVRRYFFPGTTHGGGYGLSFKLNGSSSGQCALPPNPNPESEQMRALFIDLTDWIARGTPPPSSRYPTLAQHTLIADHRAMLRPMPWPSGASATGLANPTLIYDFGKRFDYRNESGIIDRLPPAVVRVVPAAVPRMDAHGDDMGGVPSVLAQAPLGNYLGWNLYKSGPYAGRLCSFNGGFIPFARTRADRIAGNDLRPSIEERYGSRAGYMRAVRSAIDREIRDRFLLPEDAPAIMAAATTAVQTGDLSFLKP